MRTIDWIFTHGFAERFGLSWLQAKIILASQITICLASLVLAIIIMRVVQLYRNDTSLKYLRPFKITLIFILLLRAAETGLSAYAFSNPLYNLTTCVLAATAMTMLIFVGVAIPQLQGSFWIKIGGLLTRLASDQTTELYTLSTRLGSIQAELQEKSDILDRIAEKLAFIHDITSKVEKDNGDGSSGG